MQKQSNFRHAVVIFILVLFLSVFVYAGELTKRQSFHHLVTENGNIQVRMVTEYLEDGKLIDKKHGQPMTPVDTRDMSGWGQKSKDIVGAITDKAVKDAFDIEKKKAKGTGLEIIVTYDRVVDDLGRISVRRITRIYDDGEVVSKKFHRSWIMPGDDTSKGDVLSKAVADKIHTPAVVAAYQAHLAAVMQ